MTHERIVGFTGEIRDGRFVFSSADSPAIQKGDELIAVNGVFGLGAVSHFPPGESYSLRVRRGVRVFDVTQTVRERQTYEWVPQAILNLLVSLALFISASIAGRTRPDSATVRWAWLTGILAASAYNLGWLITFRTISSALGWEDPWYIAVLMAAPYLMILSIYRFMENFPAPLPESRGWRNLRRAVFAVIVIWALERIPVDIMAGLPGSASHPLHQWMWIDLADRVASRTARLLVNSAMVALLVRIWRSQKPDERRRIVLPIGAMVTARGLDVPFALLYWAGALSLAQQTLMSSAPTLLVPLAFFYGFQKHNVMGVRLVVRRTLQYVLARRFLNGMLLLPGLVIVGRAIVRPSMPVEELIHPIWAFALFTATTIFALLYRQPLLNWLDRRFFREVWDADRMLQQLLREAQKAQPFSDLLRMVGSRLDQAFHPETLHLLFRPRRGHPFPEEGGVLAEDWHIVSHLRNGKMVEWPSADHARDEVPPAEGQWLDGCGAALLVPVIADGPALSGIIVLGKRKSHLPYSEDDRRMLEALAAQLALAHDNHLLAIERGEAVAEERNRIARELHDTLAQGFAGINMHLESGKALIEADAGQARVHVEQAGALARASLAEARRSVHNLRMPETELIAMLQTLAAQFAGLFAIGIDARTHGAVRLPPSLTQTLFRIAQECVTNSIKHSGARRADILVELWPDRVQMEVRDEGRGFDSAVTPPTGWGLAGMRERARQIPADFQISSLPGQGTTVRVAAQLTSV